MKPLFIVLGTVSLLLGIMGIALPILPTTPFLLLSAWLYFRSSPTLYQKLINSRYLGQYIKDFQEDHALPLRVKIISVSMLWLTIGYSIIFVVSQVWIRLLLLGVAIGVTIHLLSFKTKRVKNKETNS